MTGCLSGGSCLFDEKKDTFSCSCKLLWTGEECGLKTGKNLKLKLLLGPLHIIIHPCR